MNIQHAKEVSAHLRQSGIFSRIEAADVIDQLLAERDAALKLAADRLEQMNADRSQYLDVRDDANRYRWLRRQAVQLSLSNDTIAGLVKDQNELDGAIQQGKAP